MELEVLREKQITNIHLNLTNELLAAKEALKKGDSLKANNLDQLSQHQRVPTNPQPEPVPTNSNSQNGNENFSNPSPDQGLKCGPQNQNSSVRKPIHDKQQAKKTSHVISDREKKLEREKHLRDLRHAREKEESDRKAAETRAENARDKSGTRKHSSVPLFVPGIKQSKNFHHNSAHTSEETCGSTAVAAHPTVNNSSFSSDAESVTQCRTYIVDSDIRKICFHELFKQDSCKEKREKCTFSHDIPPEFRTCEPLINRVKSIQAVIKKKRGGGVGNRF